MNKKFILILILVLVALFLMVLLGLCANGNESKIHLRKPLPLKLRYKVGETLHYRLIRQNINFKMDGTKFGELKAIAYYTRTRIKNDSEGRVREKFTWKSFAVGQTMTANQPVKLSYLKEAENFSFIISVQDEDALSKLDFSELPRTIEGLWFMIMTWDALTFDGLTRPSPYFKFPDSALLGTVIKSTRGPYDFLFEYPPLVTNSKYHFSGKNYSKILGISIVKNIPCVIIEFSNSENIILMNLNLKPVEIKSKGFEHFWGKTYLSLKDGRIVKGELIAPVTMVQDIKMPGQERPNHVEFFTLQKLELEMLTPDVFNFEVKNKKIRLKD